MEVQQSNKISAESNLVSYEKQIPLGALSSRNSVSQWELTLFTISQHSLTTLHWLKEPDDIDRAESFWAICKVQ